MVAFCAKTGPAAGLHDIDVAHNIGASANPLTGALRALQANLDDNITAIFTRPKNVPTPNVSEHLSSMLSVTCRVPGPPWGAPCQSMAA